MVRGQGIREVHILKPVRATALLGLLFTVAFSLADGAIQAIKPEVVIGGLIRLGKA